MFPFVLPFVLWRRASCSLSCSGKQGCCCCRPPFRRGIMERKGMSPGKNGGDNMMIRDVDPPFCQSDARQEGERDKQKNSFLHLRLGHSIKKGFMRRNSRLADVVLPLPSQTAKGAATEGQMERTRGHSDFLCKNLSLSVWCSSMSIKTTAPGGENRRKSQINPLWGDKIAKNSFKNSHDFRENNSHGK